jgi:hypothetical protein
MIARLIETSGQDKVPLSHYVIAVCYEKMITRMTYRVSISFRDALKNLPPTFKFPKQFPIRATSSNPNDRNFILSLLKHKARLGRPKLHHSIDNLAKHEEDLYNQETYNDFHSILLELLELLLMSLYELKDTHHKLGGKAPSVTQLDDAILKIDFIAVVGTLLRLVVKSQAIKRCLYSIAKFLPDRAAGIKAKVNKETDDDDDGNERDRDDEEDGLYGDDKGGLHGDDDEGGLYRDDEEDEDEDELERDDDSDSNHSMGQGSASMKLEPKSQACLRSLNLGVVYIDAILVLSRFVRNQSSKSVTVNINIKVLLLPCQSKDKSTSMLSWKTLLQHETYFPGKPSPSAKEIVDFLELRASSTGDQKPTQNTTDNQKSSKKNQKSSKKSQKSSKPLVSTEVSPESVKAELMCLRRDIHDLDEAKFTSMINQAIDSLRTLQYGDSTMKYIDRIVNKLESAKDLYPSLNKPELDEDIIEMLRTLADNTRLERMLRKGSPLDTGVGFKGTLHAEACVAAHCTFTDREWFSYVSYLIIMFCSDILILIVGCWCYTAYTSGRCI